LIPPFKTPADAEQTAPSGTPENADRPTVQDVRSQTLARRDRSEHRRHAWLYEDLLN